MKEVGEGKRVTSNVRHLMYAVVCAYANVFAFTIETQMNNYTLRKMLQEVIILG